VLTKLQLLTHRSSFKGGAALFVVRLPPEGALTIVQLSSLFRELESRGVVFAIPCVSADDGSLTAVRAA